MARGLIKHSKWTPNWSGHKESQCLVLSELTGARQSREGGGMGEFFCPWEKPGLSPAWSHSFGTGGGLAWLLCGSGLFLESTAFLRVLAFMTFWTVDLANLLCNGSLMRLTLNDGPSLERKSQLLEHLLLFFNRKQEFSVKETNLPVEPNSSPQVKLLYVCFSLKPPHTPPLIFQKTRRWKTLLLFFCWTNVQLPGYVS